MNLQVLLGVLIPFIGTSLGSAGVYVMKNEFNPRLAKGLSGFAAGVMVAASFWSLLLPAIDMVEESMGRLSWVPAAVGFVVGIIFLLFLDSVIPHQHVDSDVPEGRNAETMRRTTMMVLAVVIHNIPEEMAVGVSYAGAVAGSISMAKLWSYLLGLLSKTSQKEQSYPCLSNQQASIKTRPSCTESFQVQ